jgi:two-component system, NarL family, response regulator LiaR
LGGDNLTKRENEVLTLMTQGLNNNQIAGQMVISISTAKIHASSFLFQLMAATSDAVPITLKNHPVK